MSNYPETTLIIVNWNAGRYLQQCLNHVYDQTVKPKKILIVDNASNDNSIKNLLISDQVETEIIELDENVGFAKGNNIALSLVKTPFVALLNPDAFPDQKWLEKLLESAVKHPEAASIGSLQLMSDKPGIIDGVGDCYHASGLVWRDRHGKKIDAIDEHETEIFSPCAAAVLYRMDALKAIGFFEESFFCYCEDIDLGFRLRLAGYSAWYQPLAKVKHIGSATTGGKRSAFSIYHGHRNLMWVYWRNLPLPLLVCFLPLHISLNLLSILIFGINGNFKTILKAKIDGVKGLKQVIKQRSEIQAKRTCPTFTLARYITFKIR